MLELIKTYYAYNSWATDRLLDTCESLSEADWNAAGCSGNGSLWQTLDHMINVQRGWVSWFDGSLEMKDAIKLMLPKDLDTVSKARARWAEVKAQTDSFLDSLTEETLVADRSFVRSNGKAESHPLWKLMMHTANHGTHTRAQIVSSIRRDGKNPGNVDMLNYVLTMASAG